MSSSSEGGKISRSKSAAKDRVSKIEKSTIPGIKIIKRVCKPSVASILAVAELKPAILRRQVHNTTICASPNVSKCDSLLFFPTAFANHTNSGNLPELSNLLLSHLDKDCHIRYNYLSPHALSARDLLKLLDILSDLRPDGIMCVDSTEVVDNQINASIRLKVTDSKIVFETVARRIQNEALFPQFLKDYRKREDFLKEKILKKSWPEEEKQRLIKLAESGVDFVKHVHMQMVLTVHPESHKVTSLTMVGRIASLQLVEPDNV